MNRRQDSRMISEMKEQLKRLQERRQELESRQTDEEEHVLGQSIVPHLSRVMRDRQWAQIRCMIQRNMDTIDRDIQETIGRLGTAMLEPSEPVQSPRHFPDLIPQKKSSLKDEPHLHSNLPHPGSPSRKDLLEVVKKTLENRKKPMEENSIQSPKPMEENSIQSPRVGFYQFRHECAQQDKLNQLSIQQLPSVTIGTQKLPLNHVISVQSSSIDRPSVELLTGQPNTAMDNQQLTLEPDDVARIFSDLLDTQLELAVDSIEQLASPRQCQIKSSHVRDNDDNQSRLTIDNFTQTTIRSVKDSSTVMEPWYQTDRAVGPDLPISWELNSEEVTQVHSEEDIKEEKVDEEPLTPPRVSYINSVPVPTPAMDLNLWRQRFPPTPPSSCLESLIRQVDAAAQEASVSMMAGSSSSDATGISSSLTTNPSTSSGNVSQLSEGEAINRVVSPGQVVVRNTGAEFRNVLDGSTEETLSEGQIASDVLSNFQLMSTLIDGSSQGEILLQQTSRSDSTASFRSATGSIGEIQQSSTTDELDTE